MNNKLIEAIEVLKQFPKENVFYWLSRYEGLSNAERGVLVIYFKLL